MADDIQQGTDESALHAKIVELEAQCRELTQQNADYLNGWKRAKADYVNFKKDQEKRSVELSEVARLTGLLQYLPIVDSLRTAFAHIPSELEKSDWVRGIGHIYKQMKEILKGMGIEECESAVGSLFDPHSHQAVGQERIDDKDDNVVTQEVSVGYRMNGRIIMPAKVIVNKKPQEEQQHP